MHAGACVWVALWASPQTATVSADLAGTTLTSSAAWTEELPLSAEDLALINALGAAEPAPPAISATTTPRSSPPRAVFDALPELLVRRDYALGGGAVWRGRGGRYVPLVIDGVPWSPPIGSAYDDPLEELVDAELIDTIALEGGRLWALHEAPERLRAGVSASGGVADRSMRAHGELGARAGLFGFDLRGGYARAGELRVPSLAPQETEYGRGSAHARAALGGRRDDDFELSATFDLDLAHDRDRPDRQKGAEDERVLSRRAALRLELSPGAFEGSAALSSSGFSLRADGAEDSVEVLGASLHAALRHGALHVALDGSGDTAWTGADGRAHGARATACAELALDELRLQLQAGLHYADAEEAGRRTSGLRPIGALELEWSGLEPLRLAARAEREVYAPSFGDLRRARADLSPEDRTTFSFGPRLDTAYVELRVEGFVSLLSRAVDLDTAGRLVQRGGGALAGLDGRLELHFGQGTSATLGGGWVRGEADGAPLALVPGLTSFARVRHAFAWRDAFVEARGRLGSPLGRVSPFDAQNFDASTRARFERPRIGLAGGFALGAGVWLEAQLDDMFDVATAGFGSALPESGLDFSLTLAWRS